MEANRILKIGGTFTIVTDNQWYGKFLMRQLGGLITTTESQVSSKAKSVKSPLKEDASFHLRSLTRRDVAAADEWTVHDSIPEGKVFLFVGRPGSHAGHVVEASSYFDRLWKKSKIVERYFIVLKKGVDQVSGVASESSVKTSVPGGHGTANAGHGKQHKDFKHAKHGSSSKGGHGFKADSSNHKHSGGGSPSGKNHTFKKFHHKEKK